jgi:hypothetical protein
MTDIDTSPKTTPVTSCADETVETRVAKRRRWPLVLAVGATLVGLSFVSPAARHQWALSFIRQPSPYTTLSFQDPASLPDNIESGAHIHLTFTVANHEGRRMSYPYVLSSTNPGGTPAVRVLDRAAITVAAGKQQTTSVTVRPVCAHTTCEVEVSLLGHPETLNVLLHVHGHVG